MHLIASIVRDPVMGNQRTRAYQSK
jgi:hypothetical protein